jgi:hypothetical protein
MSPEPDLPKATKEDRRWRWISLSAADVRIVFGGAFFDGGVVQSFWFSLLTLLEGKCFLRYPTDG